jgi:hypothetical protein
MPDIKPTQSGMNFTNISDYADILVSYTSGALQFGSSKINRANVCVITPINSTFAFTFTDTVTS